MIADVEAVAEAVYVLGLLPKDVAAKWRSRVLQMAIVSKEIFTAELF